MLDIIKPAVTFQKDGIAVNINFITDDSVYVSKHSADCTHILHNLQSLNIYHYADFEQLAQKAIANGATVFTSVSFHNHHDLPLPEELIA